MYYKRLRKNIKNERCRFIAFRALKRLQLEKVQLD